MAIGMLLFAFVYIGFSFIGKKFAWREISVPSFKFAR
jgi:hypothetical protein